MTVDVYLSREEVRDVDRMAIEEYGMTGAMLMENAGANTARWLLELGVNGSVLICVGKGNNGGDGFVIARHLELAGKEVRLLLFCDPDQLQGDALLNYEICRQANLPMRIFSGDLDLPTLTEIQLELESAEWMVDALLGTGTRGEVREPFASLIPVLNHLGNKTLAIDLPSGLDCDTGEPLGPCIAANYTATFVARKKGFQNPASSQYTGEIRVLDIGAPRELLTRFGVL